MLCFTGCLYAITARVSCSAFENSVFPVANLLIKLTYSCFTSIFHISDLFTISIAESSLLYFSVSFSISSRKSKGLISVRLTSSCRFKNFPATNSTASTFLRFSISLASSISFSVSEDTCSFVIKYARKLRF